MSDPLLFERSPCVVDVDFLLLLLHCSLPLDLQACQLLSGNNNHSHRHLTSFELEGLRTLCPLLRKFKDKSIPEDLVQAQQLLDSMEVSVARHFSTEHIGL